jgi:hypothetical protein
LILAKENTMAREKKRTPGESYWGNAAKLEPKKGKPGAHPVGTGVGATAAVGAAGGLVAGPVGAAVIGGTAGGLAGKIVTDSIYLTVENVTEGKATPLAQR